MTIPPADRDVRTLDGVLGALAGKPWTLVEHWNWKTAVLSSSCRGLIFFCANASAGYQAAVAAFETELVLRFATSGFYGAITESLAGVTPAWHGMAAALVLLPVLAHSLELVVHWLRQTPELATSILASLAFTIISTSFNVFTMRRGVLTVGRGRQPLSRDLAMLPGLVYRFVRALAGGMWRAAAPLATRWR